jgi:hypothetical protein
VVWLKFALIPANDRRRWVRHEYSRPRSVSDLTFGDTR